MVVRVIVSGVIMYVLIDVSVVERVIVMAEGVIVFVIAVGMIVVVVN